MNTNTSYPGNNTEEFDIYVPHVSCPSGDCPCDRVRRCDIWMEFQISCVSLAEQDELLQGNQTEITHLRRHIDYLNDILEYYGIDHLPEYMTD